MTKLLHEMEFVPEPFANAPHGSKYYTIEKNLEILTDDERSWYVIYVHKNELAEKFYGPLPPAMAQAVVHELLKDTPDANSEL
jgi:hypothetical protein